ncbi:hypothetical protein DH2020_041870 [Rehmannia glutinosa]|uniref:Uncharacterized protein n=1 Tax=Rehmannia glutinosa TaxID=99300 RepID=A0ABR0UQD7_REHGL
MDSDFWATRLAAAKRQFNIQSNHHLSHSMFDRFNMEDLEVEEETRPDYPCPYCYEEFDIGSLCSHLEADHTCESRPTVCPVCSAKVAGDMLIHITVQHGYLFKISRRSRLRRFPFPNNQSLSLLGRDLREAHLQLFLGGSGYRSNSNTATSSSSAVAADNFLSSLVLNFSASETDEVSKSLMSSLEENSTKSVASQHMWKSSFQFLSREEREQRMRQASGRAVFIQDVLVSTLLAD